MTTGRRQLRLYFELLVELARRETRRRYKDTLLGWLWIILIPLLQSAVIAFLFVRLSGIDLTYDNTPYVLIVLSGFTMWNFVSHTVSQSMTALSGNMELINTQPLPLSVLPLSVVFVKTYDWLTELLVFIVISILMTGVLPHSFWLGIVPLTASLILFVAGLSLIISLIGSLIRDAGHLISLFLSVWFWMTPLLYPAERIADRFKWINLNPLVHFLAAFRQISLYDVLDVDKLAKLFVCSAVFFLFALLFFHRQSWRIYDRP